MPYKKLDAVEMRQAKQDAILRSTEACGNWQKCHPEETFTPMGIGLVLSTSGEAVNVPILEEFKQKAPFVHGYIPQTKVANYLNGLVADYGLANEYVARVGTLGATGALAAAVAFLNQGSTIDSFSGYGLAGQLVVVRPADSWDNLDGLFAGQGLPIKTFRMFNRKGEIDAGDMERVLRMTRANGKTPLLYIQSDTGNMTGYRLTKEVRSEIASHCADTGAIVLAECVYRGTSAGKKWEIARSYMEDDIALVLECVHQGIPVFWTHSESKRGNFPGRVGALLHVPRQSMMVPSVQSQLNKLARVSGFWFLPETFVPYDEIYRVGAVEHLHKDVCQTTIARIVDSSEENLTFIPRGQLHDYWERLRGLTRIIPVKEGAAERLLHDYGIGTIMIDACETDSGPAIRVNTTGNLMCKGKKHMKKLWNAISTEYRPFVVI